MPCAMVAQLGSGICFLFSVALVGLFTIAWWSYWTLRITRFGLPTGVGRIGFRLLFVLCLFLMLCVVPMRRRGTWIDVDRGKPVQETYSATLDRDVFGYIPTWRWVGTVGTAAPLASDISARIDAQPLCRLTACFWTIHWLALVVEVSLAFAWLSPFLLAIIVPTQGGDRANSRV